MKVSLILSACFALVPLGGCQSVSSAGNPLLSIDYDFSYTDAPDEKRLKLSFVSKSKRELCLGREFWPSSGRLATESGNSNGVYLIVEKRIYAYQNSDFTDYCTEKSCFNPVALGETRQAFLDYEGFGLQEAGFRLAKELKYKPQPFWCDQGKFTNLR